MFRSLVLLLMLVAFIVVSHIPLEQISATTPMPTEEPTAFPTPRGTDKTMPFILMPPLSCPKDTKVVKGITWRSITIGESTLGDLEELYGVLAPYPVPIDEKLFARTNHISLTATVARNRKLAQSAEVCRIDGTIVALLLSLNNEEFLSPHLADWLLKYGEPEIVTWTPFERWRYRVVVWPQYGIALNVDTFATVVEPREAYADMVVFFPPTPLDWTQWPYAGFVFTPEGIPNDKGYPSQENPFDFPLLMGTVTPTEAADK